MVGSYGGVFKNAEENTAIGSHIHYIVNKLKLSILLPQNLNIN